jgi:hypothetical protein
MDKIDDSNKPRVANISGVFLQLAKTDDLHRLRIQAQHEVPEVDVG